MHKACQRNDIDGSASVELFRSLVSLSKLGDNVKKMAADCVNLADIVALFADCTPLCVAMEALMVMKDLDVTQVCKCIQSHFALSFQASRAT